MTLPPEMSVSPLLPLSSRAFLVHYREHTHIHTPQTDGLFKALLGWAVSLTIEINEVSPTRRDNLRVEAAQFQIRCVSSGIV